MKKGVYKVLKFLLILLLFNSCAIKDEKKDKRLNKLSLVKSFKTDTLFNSIKISVPDNWIKNENLEINQINYSFDDKVNLEFKPNFSIQVFNLNEDINVLDFANNYIETIKSKVEIKKIELQIKLKINHFDKCALLFFHFNAKENNRLGEITCFYKDGNIVYKVTGRSSMQNEKFFFKCYRIYEKAIWSLDKI